MADPRPVRAGAKVAEFDDGTLSVPPRPTYTRHAGRRVAGCRCRSCYAASHLDRLTRCQGVDTWCEILTLGCDGKHHPGQPHDYWGVCSGNHRSYAEHRAGVAA